MLKKTFCHIDGVSEDVERKLISSGYDWDSFISNSNEISFLPKNKIEKIKTEILFSKKMLEEKNISYFQKKIPEKYHYRLFNYGKTAFVDIETTGLSRYTDEITLIGIYDGENIYQYISGKNLKDGFLKLKEYDIVVTFNGKNFDIPFIETKINEKYNFVQLDLRFMLKEIGFSGGLKKIEKELGIQRCDEVNEVDGRQAVRLWYNYKNGNENSLKKLMLYNREDIVNLKYLIEFYFSKKDEKNK